MLATPTMISNYGLTTDSANRYDEPTGFPFGFGGTDWDQFNFEPLMPCMTEGGHTLSSFSPLQPPVDFHSLLLSPPSVSESSSTYALQSPHAPTPDLSLAGPASIQPPSATQPTPRPPTPPSHAQEPAPNKIGQFDYCPWTRLGGICGYTSWARSGNKQIKRHLKNDHFPDTSLGYECPNPVCTRKNYRFLRKDACNEHRRGCNLVQAPGYVPLPNIVSGDDAEVDRWMRARRKQRMEIIKKLRNGTAWSEDLLQPVSI